MENPGAWETLPGKTPAEKLGSLGVTKDAFFNILMLDEIGRTHGVKVILFFEDDLARSRSLESVIEEFGTVPEYERPFISIDSFLRFTQENDPSFEQTMREFPLMIRIVTTGEMQSELSGPVRYITGLMPFLDELDVDTDSSA
jgi:hypothetical protein